MFYLSHREILGVLEKVAKSYDNASSGHRSIALLMIRRVSKEITSEIRKKYGNSKSK